MSWFESALKSPINKLNSDFIALKELVSVYKIC